MSATLDPEPIAAYPRRLLRARRRGAAVPGRSGARGSAGITGPLRRRSQPGGLAAWSRAGDGYIPSSCPREIRAAEEACAGFGRSSRPAPGAAARRSATRVPGGDTCGVNRCVSILATNVAETSVTIDGVTVVITWAGARRQPRSLVGHAGAQGAAAGEAARVGRATRRLALVAPRRVGVRLYTEHDHDFGRRSTSPRSSGST